MLPGSPNFDEQLDYQINKQGLSPMLVRDQKIKDLFSLLDPYQKSLAPFSEWGHWQSSQVIVKQFCQHNAIELPWGTLCEQSDSAGCLRKKIASDHRLRKKMDTTYRTCFW